MSVSKTHSVAFFVVVGFGSLQFQCQRTMGCAENIYQFNMDITARPDSAAVNVGDTVWFDVDESSTLTDQVAGAPVDYSGAANLSTVVSFNQLAPDSSDWSILARSQFDLVLSLGTFQRSIEPSRDQEISLAESDGNYGLRLGVIPKVVGIYRILFGNAANVFRQKDQ